MKGRRGEHRAFTRPIAVGDTPRLDVIATDPPYRLVY
jgi:hypothetical protein